MPRITGLELLFKHVKNEIKSKEDCLVAALHCLFITNEKFNVKCVGIGEQFSDADNVLESELLPETWNLNQEVYTLRYLNDDHSKRYLVKIVEAGNMLLVNVVLNEKTIATMTANTSDFISDDFKQFSSTYKDLKPLLEAFEQDIVQKLMPNTNNSSSPSFKKQEESEQPIPSRNPLPPARPSAQIDPYSVRPENYPLRVPPVGNRDLDPLGRGFGGMLMDPRDFRFPRPDMPPGVPPGARFDPFSPPIVDRFGGNPNSRRPPDYDDMFM